MKLFIFLLLLFCIPDPPAPGITVPKPQEPPLYMLQIEEINLLQGLRTGDPVKDRWIEKRQAVLIHKIVGDHLNFF